MLENVQNTKHNKIACQPLPGMYNSNEIANVYYEYILNFAVGN